MHLFESFRRAAAGLMIGLVLGLRILEYVGLGVDSFIFSGYPHLEEAYRVD